MKKPKVRSKTKGNYEFCAACGKKVLKQKGAIFDGKFYCAQTDVRNLFDRR